MRTYQVVIDEDVPISKKKSLERSRYCHPLSWLLPKMKPGDSFVYPASTGEAHDGLRAMCYQVGKQKGRKFATRQVEDREGVKRLRIWRTA